MATEAEKSVYPNSTPSGEAIPYDVGEPKGLWITPFATAASAEKELPVSWEDQIVVLYATEDCVIAFGDSVTLNLNQDVEKLDHQLIPRQTPVSIKLPARKFKTIRISADGLLYIQRYRRWQALSTEELQTRI